LRVQRQTLDFISENHAEAMALAAEATGLDREAVEEMFTLYDFRMDITDADLTALEHG
jgi:hypothetical protein